MALEYNRDMRAINTERIVKAIAIIVPTSLIYFIYAEKIWANYGKITDDSELKILLIVSFVIIIGAGLYFYQYIFSNISLRLSPPMFKTTVCYMILASIPFVGVALFDTNSYIQNTAIAGLVLCLALVAFMIGYIRKSRHAPLKTPDNLSFLNDSIDKKVEFTQGQKNAAHTLLSLLKDLGKYQNIGPLSIAVNGKWGDGKTTIVDSVLSEIGEKQFIIVRFDPWRYTNQENLVSGFYDEIGRAIARKLPGFRTARVDFAKFARNFISTITKTQSLVSSIEFTIANKSSFPQKIDKHLNQSNKRLLVVIDDVERIYEDEHITRTLQLAQYMKGDIKNSAIIFLTDIHQIETAIPKRLNGSSYLQKFFDTTVIISPPSRAEMLKFMNHFLKKLDFKTDVQLSEDVQLSMLMRNVRGVKRVLSMLANDIQAVEDNVNAQDILFLRSLYYAHPSIYIDMRENTSMYFGYSYDYNDVDFSYYGFSEESFEAAQIEHFSKLFSEMNISSRETKKIKALLEDYLPALGNVFRESGTGKRHVDYGKLSRGRRIGSREYLERYFIFSEDVDKKHKVEKQIDKFIENHWGDRDEKRYSALSELYSDFIDDTKKLFVEIYLQKIEDIVDDNRESASAMRKKHYRDILRVNLSKTDYIQVDGDGTLMRTLGAIDRNLVPADFPYIFEGLVAYINHPTVSLRVALYMNPQRDNGLHYLRKYERYNELREQILASVDDYYLKNKNNVLEEEATSEKDWIFVVAQWSTSVCYDDPEGMVVERFTKVNSYLLKLVNDNAGLLLKLIQGAFWSNDLVRNKYRYFFNIKPKAYNHELFVKEAKKWLKNKNEELSNEQKQILKLFVDAYSKFLEEEGKKNQTPSIDEQV